MFALDSLSNNGSGHSLWWFRKCRDLVCREERLREARELLLLLLLLCLLLLLLLLLLRSLLRGWWRERGGAGEEGLGGALGRRRGGRDGGGVGGRVRGLDAVEEALDVELVLELLGALHVEPDLGQHGVDDLLVLLSADDREERLEREAVVLERLAALPRRVLVGRLPHQPQALLQKRGVITHFPQSITHKDVIVCVVCCCVYICNRHVCVWCLVCVFLERKRKEKEQHDKGTSKGHH